MRKHNILEVYIRRVQDMCQGTTTCVNSKRGISEHFEVEIGLNLGLALSPFLFIMLLDTISQDVRSELVWELLYADDLATIDITSTDTQNRLESQYIVPALGDPRRERPPAVYGHVIDVPTHLNVKLPGIGGHLPNADADNHLLVVRTCYNGQYKQLPRFRWSFQPIIACGAHPNL